MNWKETWNTIATAHRNPEEQVGRVRSGSGAIGKNLPEVTAAHIAGKLKLSSSDNLLDICCGNGLLTIQFAKICGSVTGIDFSPAMVEAANEKNAGPNIRYEVGDAMNLTRLPEAPFDKICLNYSFQYFEKYADGRKVVAELIKQLKPGGLLLLGEVPDYARRWKFYQTWKSRLYLLYHTLAGKNLMGKFWKKQELDRICRELQVNGTLLEQPAGFPYAHYRFDYLIEKPIA